MNNFEKLNGVNVSEKIEKKGKLSYLSWVYAWAEFKKMFPNSFYTIYENANGMNYHTDGNTCWVKTGVTLVDGDERLEHIEYLPVMDYRNQSIVYEKVTSMDVNTAIQRSITKAIARHGLGLYIYAGEDLPEDEAAKTGKAKTGEVKTDEEAKVKVGYQVKIQNFVKANDLNWEKVKKELRINDTTPAILLKKAYNALQQAENLEEFK